MSALWSTYFSFSVFALFVYAIPTLMPSRLWLAVFALIAGVPLAILWGQHFHAAAQPAYNEGPFGFIGVGLVALVTVSLAAGAIARGIGLIRFGGQYSPWRAYLIHCTGAVLLVSVPAALLGWSERKRRPPTEMCLRTKFDVQLGGLRLNIPAAPFFNLYPKPRSRSDAYYLSIPQHVRDLCTETNEGRKPLTVSHIRIQFLPRFMDWKQYCDRRPSDWTQTLCALERPEADRNPEFPSEADLFIFHDVDPRHFGAKMSTAVAAEEQRGSGEEYFSVDARTSDGKPLTFACRSNQDNYSCMAGYPWRDGLTINYRFNAHRDDIVTRGLRADRLLHEFIDQVMIRR